MDHDHHDHNHNHGHESHNHSHDHDQGHDHGHDHHHNHDHHQHDQKGTDSDDLHIVENRDLESNKRWSNNTIANHVWDSCKPHAKITVKSPTVSARRVQLMRAQFQPNSKDCNAAVSNELLSTPCCNKTSTCESKSKKSINSPDSSLSDVIHACPSHNEGSEKNEQNDFRL